VRRTGSLAGRRDIRPGADGDAAKRAARRPAKPHARLRLRRDGCAPQQRGRMDRPRDAVTDA
jgi:hypothetical protein